MSGPPPMPGPAPGWLTDLPVPAAVVDEDGMFHWRNPAWLSLDPIDGIPFVWPLEFFGQLSRVIRESRGTVMRGVQDRLRRGSYDLWLGRISETDGLAWILATEVTVYEQSMRHDLADARIREGSVMIQGILHEMRNPLAGIQGTAQLLKRRLKATESAEMADQILSDVRRIDDVFQELTVLAGALKLHRRPANLHALLEEALKTMAPLFEAKGVRVERLYDPSLPELEVDPDRIYRVYLNLLRNALDASPPAATIEIGTELEHHWWPSAGREPGSEVRTGGTGWTTRIRDEGEGIDESARPLLFTPLYTTKATGTGLGLPICLQIVQAHGGVLSLRNREDGRGTEAAMTLPIERRREPRP